MKTKRRYPGNYNERDKQWAVMVKGVFYYRTLEELGATTKEESVKAWKDYVAIIKGQAKEASIEPQRRKLLKQVSERIAVAPADELPRLQQLKLTAEKASVHDLPDITFFPMPTDEVQLMGSSRFNKI